MHSNVLTYFQKTSIREDRIAPIINDSIHKHPVGNLLPAEEESTNLT